METDLDTERVGGGSGTPILQTAWVLLLVLVASVPVATGNLTVLGMSDPLTADQFQLPKFAIIVVLTAAMAAALAWDTTLRGSRLWWHGSLWLLSAFVLWTTLATVFSVDVRTSVLGSYARYEGLIASCIYAVLVFATVQLSRSVKRVGTLCLVIVASGAVVATYALAQSAGVDPVSWGAVSAFGDGTFFGTYGNPDLLAGFLVMPFVLSAGMALASPNERRRIGYWTAFVLLATALVASTVRGAWLGGIVGIGSLLLLSWRSGVRPRRLDAVVLLGGLAGGLVLMLATGTTARIVDRITAVLSPSGSVAQRLDIWSVAARSAAIRPIIGWGPDTFGWAFARTFGDDFVLSWGEGFVVDAAHNHVLHLAVTIGIVGAVLFVGFAASVLWTSLPATRPSTAGMSRLPVAAVWASVTGLLTYLLSGVAVPGVSVFVWVGLGVLVATRARPIERPLSGRALRVSAVAVSLVLAAAVSWSATLVWADHQLVRAVRDSSPGERSSAFDRAVHANPLSAEYQYRRVSGALDSFRTAARLGQAGSVLQQVLAEARLDAEAAIEAFGADPRGYVTYSILLNEGTAQGMGDLSEEAASVARRGLAASPSEPRALYQLAVATARSGRLEDSARVLRRLLDMSPDSLGARLLLGDVYAELGDDDRAVEQYEAAQAIDPENPDVRSRLGEER